MSIHPDLPISVIIPVYNSVLKLKKCLEALEKQTYSREQYEIIVIDDGSVENINSMVNDLHIRYYLQPHRGPAAARNKGVEMAKGSIVLFTDADCMPDENWIQAMVSSFQSPEIVAVKGVYNTRQQEFWARFAQIEFNERYKLLLKNKFIDMIDTYSAGFRKDAFLSTGGFDTSFPFPNNEDTDLSYKMSQKGYKMVFNPDAVVWHSGHPDTLRKYMKLKFWRGYWRMVVYQRHAHKMIKDSYTPQTLKFQIIVSFLLILTLFLMPFNPSVMFYLFLIGAFLFLASALPFVRIAMKDDIRIGLLSPFLLFLRAISLGSGALFKLLKRS